MLPRESDSLDARVLEYELKESEQFRRDRLLAAGRWEILVELLEEGDQVLIILGAESFDKERRVVYAPGIPDQLADIVTALEKKKIHAVGVVVAES